MKKLVVKTEHTKFSIFQSRTVLNCQNAVLCRRRVCHTARRLRDSTPTRQNGRVSSAVLRGLYSQTLAKNMMKMITVKLDEIVRLLGKQSIGYNYNMHVIASIQKKKPEAVGRIRGADQ